MYSHSPSSGSAPDPEDSGRWSVSDLIDFDYYIDEDERLMRESASERKRLVERDRRLYRDKIEPALRLPEHTAKHRSLALRRWLAARRGNEDPALRPLLPGAAFARGQRLVTIGLGVLGFVTGIGVASALLQYDGVHPVNVSWYVFVLVILQLVLAGATLAFWYGRRSSAVKTAAQDFSLIGNIFKPLFSRTARWVQRQRLAHTPPDIRERAETRRGLLEAHYALYGSASYLPVLIPAQVFGIGFNIGAIIITVALEWFTDLAFGWGSALNVQPQTIHSIAHFIALPWTWLLGDGVGVPTLEQIAGTRINLKDPLYILDAAHLRSWRWFVVLAVITYGLLPRLILLGLSVLKQRRALAALPFTHQRAQGLYARLITPSLQTGELGSGQGPEMPIPAPLKPLTAPTAAPRPEPSGKPPPTDTVAGETIPVPPPSGGPPAPAESAGAARPPSAQEPSAEQSTLLKPARVPLRDGRPKVGQEAKAQPEATIEPKGEAGPEVAPLPKSEPEPASAPASKAKPKRKPKPKPKGKAEPGADVSRGERAEPAPSPPEEKPAAEETGPVHKPAAAPAAEPELERAGAGEKAPETARRAPAQPPAEPRAERSLSPEQPAPPVQTPPPASAVGVDIAAGACVLLLHIDVADVLEESDHARLQQMLRQHTGWQVAASATYGGGRAMADQATSLIAEGRWRAPPARVALVQDGSQPPITESLRFLRAVRAAAGEHAQVVLALVGDPDGDDPLPPLSEFDFTDWKRKIDQMGDPYLRLEMLAGPAEEQS
ncbi:MAG: DUF2868 domain-containing protein [Thiohalocapsa sp.]|nr:DUF2868 domain-containing protein [Thiohalocapsa sp.]MCF7992638.1 DUF2868 domain-containing protein [Thiohalocapsa sp.]